MMGIWIQSLNLSSPLKYFDITLSEEHYSSGFVLTNFKNIPLIQCTPEHINFNEELRTLQYKFPITNGLCPEISQSLTVGGKATSNLYVRLVVRVDRCNSTADPMCANDTVFAAHLAAISQFTLVLPIIKQDINAGNKLYKEFIIEEQHRFLFDSTLGVSG